MSVENDGNEGDKDDQGKEPKGPHAISSHTNYSRGHNRKESPHQVHILKFIWTHSHIFYSEGREKRDQQKHRSTYHKDEGKTCEIEFILKKTFYPFKEGDLGPIHMACNIGKDQLCGRKDEKAKNTDKNKGKMPIGSITDGEAYGNTNHTRHTEAAHYNPHCLPSPLKGDKIANDCENEAVHHSAKSAGEHS